MSFQDKVNNAVCDFVEAVGGYVFIGGIGLFLFQVGFYLFKGEWLPISVLTLGTFLAKGAFDHFPDGKAGVALYWILDTFPASLVLIIGGIVITVLGMIARSSYEGSN